MLAVILILGVAVMPLFTSTVGVGGYQGDE